MLNLRNGAGAGAEGAGTGARAGAASSIEIAGSVGAIGRDS